MKDSSLPRIEINGRPADVDSERILALGSYGHFTAMQVRGGRTRGLNLHLQRLDAANRELFGRPLDGDIVRGHIRHALLDGVADASVRVYAFSPDADAEISIVVTVKPPGAKPNTPQHLKSVGYQRAVAHIKHSGDFGQEYFRRLARRNGFDDALLTGPDGVISESTIANVGFFDGTAVVWPEAPALAGITMQLIEQGFAGKGMPSRRQTVRLSDMTSFEAAFLTNSRGVAAIGRVDDLSIPVSAGLTDMVAEVYESAPWDPI
jgi:branched-subunit amino acid aminotransferase/4-amino-4-deoxychorismate lyase